MTLHEALVQLNKMVEEGEAPAPELGICDNVKYIAGENFSDEIADISSEWPEYSGNITFPVPHPTLSPRDGYIKMRKHWTGKYGAARRRFLDFLIQRTAP